MRVGEAVGDSFQWQKKGWRETENGVGKRRKQGGRSPSLALTGATKENDCVALLRWAHPLSLLLLYIVGRPLSESNPSLIGGRAPGNPTHPQLKSTMMDNSPAQQANLLDVYKNLNLAGCIVVGNASTIALCTNSGSGAYYNGETPSLLAAAGETNSSYFAYFCGLPSGKKTSADVDRMTQIYQNESRTYNYDVQIAQCGYYTSAAGSARWKQGLLGVGLTAWVALTSVMVAC